MKKILACIIACGMMLGMYCSEQGFAKTKTPNPIFKPAGGVYKTTIKVSITSPEPLCRIYYTLDGTTPTTKSNKYKKALKISTNKVVRAMVVTRKGKKYYAMTGYEFDLDRTTDAISRMPSPKWRDQVIYFLLTDRFANGDSSNNDQGANESASVESRWNGGDFAGITDHLNYIKELGATAIWLTPPVKNEWYDGYYTGYHGYWASDFMKVDEHYGTLHTYKSMVQAAHSRNMYVIQDIVTNHTGDFFQIPGSEQLTYNDLSSWSITTDCISERPTSVIWRMNNPNELTKDEFEKYSFYHWTPEIKHFDSYTDELFTYQVSDLDDINTDNPVVENLLRGYYRYWIEKADVDAYRIDTIRYVKPSFFGEFINSKDKNNLGVREYAKTLGKTDFLSFGENLDNTSTPAQNCAMYTQGANSERRCDSMLNYPLAHALRAVVSGGQPSANLTTALNERYTAGYLDPDLLVNFIDNHDNNRLLSCATPEMTKAAYGVIMTINGIPQLYYGCEQGLTVTRPAMFAGGYKDSGKTNSGDLFNQSGEWWNFFKDIIAVRNNYRVFRYNKLNVVCDQSDGVGLFAYTLKETNDNNQVAGGVQKEAFFVMNNATTSKIYNSTSNFEEGDKLTLLQPSTSGMPDKLLVGENGQISTAIPGNAYGIYLLTSKGETNPVKGKTVTITSNYSEPIKTGSSINVTGTVSDANSSVNVIIDNNVSRAITTTANGTNWEANIDISLISNGSHEIKAFIGDTSAMVVSNTVAVTLNLDRQFSVVAELADLSSDDMGPVGKNYSIPTDSSFAGHPQDIKNVKVWRCISDIWIDLNMASVCKTWGPTVNPFDHVMFSVFISDGDNDGSIYNPNHNYTLPNFAWDYLLNIEGWSTSMYSKSGANDSFYGTAVTPVPTCEVDWSADTDGDNLITNGVIRLKISAETLGFPENLSGWKIYISTWDADSGRLRDLTPAITPYWFGGGNFTVDPLVIDETGVITIP